MKEKANKKQQRAKAAKYALGLTVTSRAVHAVLLETGTSEPQVLKRFLRQRDQGPAPAMKAGAAAPAQEASDDFSIQIGGTGGGASANDLFLQSEFGTLDGSGKAGEAGVPEPATTFEVELVSILEECREAGFPDPTLAFCAGPSDVTHVEVRVLEVKKKKKEAKKNDKGDGRKDRAPAPSASSRRLSTDKLIEHLSEQHQAPFDPERVAFLRMVPTEDGVQRYLAVIAKSNEPVAATLRTLRSNKRQRMPAVRLLDAEVSQYMGLARALLPSKERAAAKGDEAAPPEAFRPQNTLIVRAGVDNTLVLFLQGEALLHYESMRSLTAFDAPETICSRVLLHQDENGIDDVHHVLILSEEQEDALVKSFQTFFPGAGVKALRTYLEKLGGEKPAPEMSAVALVPATGVALRLVEKGGFKDAFEDVNLLTKQLLRRKIQIPYSWHVGALALLLFFTTLFFVFRFFTQERQIHQVKKDLGRFEPAIAETNMKVLQARIDSLQQVREKYLHALGVLDSLLVGSDQWSRALEQTSKEAVATTGIWIERWRPQESSIELIGNATSRARVVEFAERTQGNIEALTFSEIREWPVYSFTLEMPLKKDLPEAAKYLRERALTERAQAEADSGEAPPEGEAVPVTSASLPARP